MSNLYEQAIADAKKLKEVAEQNATNKIIESIAPQIRRLIEQEISDEIAGDLEAEDDPVEEMIDTEDPDLFQADLDAESTEGLMSPAAAADEFDNLDVDPYEEDAGEEEKNVTVNITVESRLDRRAKQLREHAVKLVVALRETKSKKQKTKILSELSKIKKLLVVSNLADKQLRKEINEVLKESKKMSSRKKSWINENTWWLFEGEEGEDEDLDLELEDEDDVEDEEEEAVEEVDVSAIKSAVEELALAVGMETTVAADADVDAEVDEDEDEFEDEDEDIDLDLEEIDDMGMYEADQDPKDEKDEEIVEISEAAIRRELRRMKGRTPARRQRKNARLSETARRRRAAAIRRRRMLETGDPMSAQASFGGSDEVIEVSEEDLINALADELGNSHGEDLNIDGQGDATAMADHFGGGKAEAPASLEEARRRRALRRQRLNGRGETTNQRKRLTNLQREAKAAKAELKESNLFNAKLLYVNKLMQQHDLNAKQQRAIVEALDNAKTHREAKLLYTSLTESLRRRAQSKNSSSNLNEGLVRGGSASSPARSSAPANTSRGLDRWATLAGIKK
jgi:hypothetical protein